MLAEEEIALTSVLIIAPIPNSPVERHILPSPAFSPELSSHPTG